MSVWQLWKSESTALFLSPTLVKRTGAYMCVCPSFLTCLSCLILSVPVLVCFVFSQSIWFFMALGSFESKFFHLWLGSALWPLFASPSVSPKHFLYVWGVIDRFVTSASGSLSYCTSIADLKLWVDGFLCALNVRLNIFANPILQFEHLVKHWCFPFSSVFVVLFVPVMSKTRRECKCLLLASYATNTKLTTGFWTLDIHMVLVLIATKSSVLSWGHFPRL